MPFTRSDLYGSNITALYATCVELHVSDNDVYYLNDCGESLSFGGHTYIPVGFSVTEPNKGSTEEGTGTFSIVGVPSSYIQSVQSVEGTMHMKVGLVKVNTAQDGTAVVEGADYLYPALDYKVTAFTVNSSAATLTMNLSTGGALGYLASRRTFDASTFPGLVG